MIERREERRKVAGARQRFEPAHDVVDTLRRLLLPDGLPLLPGVQIAASYLPAGAEAAAGGDWFDAVPLAHGRVALVVGDVVGHGVAASATMGQLRAVLHDRLDETGDPVIAVTAADRMARWVPGARAATVCVVVLDPADGTLACCSAGHPPPLISGPDGTRFLASSGHGPLSTGASYTVTSERLGTDETILLYTDGIIGRPGRTPAAATAELSLVAGDAIAGRIFAGDTDSAVERACTHTLERLVRETGHTDDITLLAAQLRAAVPPLRLTGPGDPGWIGIARTAVDAWVTLHHASEPDRVAFAHGIVELVTNAVEHARPGDGDCTVTVTAELLAGGEVRLAVADNGRWRERARPGDPHFRRDHGYGLAMTAALADRLDVDRGKHGTTVTMSRHVVRPARLPHAEEIGFGASTTGPEPPETLRIVDQPDAPSSRIAVHGPLDATTVEDLGPELDRYTLGGTHRLIVDLTGVTHLASVAVAELYRGGNERPSPLTLYAPADSTAHHVLSIVGLPHTTVDPHGIGSPPEPGPSRAPFSAP